MAPKSKRKIGRPSRSNQELLEKSLELFLQNGFERTSIDAIIASAGMAKRTIYSRYEDKAGLFKAALKHAIDGCIVPIEQLQALECDDLHETLSRIALAHLANILDPTGLRVMRLAGAESVRMPEVGAYAVGRGTGPTVAVLTDLFARRISGDLPPKDREEAAGAFLHLAVGGPANMALWGVPLDAEQVERHVRDYVALFLQGLLPRTPETGKGEGKRKTSSAKSNSSGGEETEQLEAVKDENRRLKLLLAETMLELAQYKDRLK